MANGDVLRISTGQMDWSGGVNSDKTPTIQGPGNPNGLGAAQLAWLNNGTVRGGGIAPRRGWRRLLEMPVTALHQVSYMYKPDDGFPYIVTLVGGRLYRVRVDVDNSVEDISGSLTMPLEPLAFMVQGENFLIVQAGDYLTLPLFWDGATLRRSNGPSVSYGVLSAPFNAPAIGSIIAITLTTPYSGVAGQIFQIDGNQYQQVDPDSIATIQNDWGSFAGTIRPTPGTVIPAGTQFFSHLAAPPTGLVLTTLVDYITPDYGASIVGVPVLIAASNTGFAYFLSPDPAVQYVQRIVSTSYPPLGANQIYVINLDDAAGNAHAAGETLISIPELPAAGPMDYYMGRVWLANGREYIAGDIVGGPSGTAEFGYRDSILRTNENTYISLGGTFVVPDVAGNIRALKHPITLDTALGEGQLYVFTSERVYSVNVVPTRAAWKALSEPIQRVAQINFGTPADRSVVGVNGDLFFRALDGVRSMTQAVRYFEQWGNIPISVEENRVIDVEDRSMLRFASSILFDNRVLLSCLPQQSDIGVVFKGLMPLNFDTISTLAEKLPPAWEGVNEGLDILQVLTGDFGGLVRAFAFVRSSTGKLELWELTLGDQEDTNLTGDSRIQWALETPAFTWAKPFDLKELDTLELWIDRLFGTVEFIVEFRPDQHPCWEYWFAWQACAPRNNCELIGAPLLCPYPTQTFRQQYRAMMVLPKPPTTCEIQNARPINIGYQFQFRIFVKGFARIRGIMVHAYPRMKAPYERIVCADSDPSNTPMPMRTIGS